MSYPILTGAVLVEANGAALNNQGTDEGRRTDNAVVTKSFRIGSNTYPYVSGQAWRRWWREVLYEDFNWSKSSVTRRQKSAYTEGNPIKYEEDDIFGYMTARKKEEGGTFKRTSPLKNSLLISVIPNTVNRDVAHFSRNLEPGEDIIPFESENYTTYLQGAFTVSLFDVGRFEVGPGRDIPNSFTEENEHLSEIIDGRYELPREKRIKRVQDTLKALSVLRYGANLTRNLSDVSPVMVLIGFLDGGNAPFQKLCEPTKGETGVLLNMERLKSVLQDYSDRFILGDGGSIYFGYRPTILTNEERVVTEFEKEPLAIQCVGSPREAIEQAAQQVEAIFNEMESSQSKN